jgi:hypothetical protein
MKKIGVVILAHSWSEKFRDAADSVFAATKFSAIDDVTVWVNAGSKSCENIAEIKGHLGTRCSRWRFASPETSDRLPMYENWNLALSKCNASYVHLMHDDDTLSRYFYSEHLRMIESYPDAGFYAVSVLVRSEGCLRFTIRENRAHGPGELSPILAHYNIFFSPEIVINKERFERFPVEFSYCGDWRCYYLNSTRNSIVTSSEPLFSYNMGFGNISSSIATSKIRFSELASVELLNCQHESIRRKTAVRPTLDNARNTATFFARRAIRSRRWRHALAEVIPLIRGGLTFKICRALASSLFLRRDS